MSPSAKRIAIAEACGWRVVVPPQGAYFAYWQLGTLKTEDLPDYLNNLNAMHEALSTKKGDEAFWCAYWDALCDLTGAEKTNDWGKHWTDTELLLNSTAAQCADAFLKAVRSAGYLLASGEQMGVLS